MSTNNCMAEHVDAGRGISLLMPMWNFTKLSLTLTVNVYLSVTINSAVKNCSAQTRTNFDDWQRFCCDIALLFYEHVYSHKEHKKRKENSTKTAIYSLAYIYIKQVIHQINSWTLRAQKYSSWLRSTVGGTPVFGRRTDTVLSVLRLTFRGRVTTMWVNRPLKISQLGQLSLSSFRGR